MSESCYHCGLPVPPQGGWQVTVEGQARPVCCPACQAVAETILASGLTGYYRQRSAPADTPASATTDASLYDREELQRDCTQERPDGLRETRLSLQGIRCAACVWLIEQQLARQPGVESAVVSLADHSATLHWSPDTTRLSRLIQALREIGYDAFPHQPDDAEQARKAEARDMLKRLGVAGIGMMQVGMAAVTVWEGGFTQDQLIFRDLLNWTGLLLATVVVGYSALPFFRHALASMRARRLGMDVPVSLAILSIYAASLWGTLQGEEHVYFDSATMFVFLLLTGRYLELRARHAAYRAIGAGEGAIPQQARRLASADSDPASAEAIPASLLQPGDCLLVKAGEPFPADGLLLRGETTINEAALTGEFLPRPRQPGDAVTGGTLNIEQPVVMAVEATGQQTRLATIERLMARALLEKPRLADIADRAASHFTALVLVATALTVLAWYFIAPERAFWIGVALLAVTCPCALSLATPTALAACLAALRRAGLLVTRAGALEALAAVTHVVLDKTGTLTEGRLVLQRIQPVRGDADQALAVARALEQHSEHPLARAFLEREEGPALQASDVRLQAGHGLTGEVAGTRYRLGSPSFTGAGMPPTADERWISLADEHGPVAWFEVSDQLRPSAAPAVAALREAGLELLLLSGDSSPAVAQVAAELGIPAEGSCTPEQKLARVRELQARGARVLMVGDGLNDAPVLAGADVSVAIGDASDLARFNADCVLMSGDLGVLPRALARARQTRGIMSQNLGWAMAYNGIAIPLAAVGMVSPFIATLGMSLSSIVVILNATRLTRHL